jgi:hypothetical protein
LFQTGYPIFYFNQSSLKKNAIIKKISSAFLLAVFILAITPKKMLHDSIVRHTDGTSRQADHECHKITKPIFSCVCDSLVAESLFEAASFSIASAPVLYSCYRDQSNPNFYIATTFFPDLRGPPLKFQS